MLVTSNGRKIESDIHKVGDKVIVAEHCLRCDGTGQYYHYGSCFSCGGTGRHHKSRKLYTQEQQLKLEARKARTRDLKEQKHKDQLEKNNAKVEELKVAHVEIWDFISNRDHDSFLLSIKQQIENGKDLSEKQVEAVKKVIFDEQQKPESNFIGEIGERREFTGKVTRFFEGVNNFGFFFIINLDVDGDQVVYKGSKFLGEKGETVTIKATVKDHDFFRGEKQTLITRPQIKEQI